jgi:hypothetical protein
LVGYTSLNRSVHYNLDFYSSIIHDTITIFTIWSGGNLATIEQRSISLVEIVYDSHIGLGEEVGMLVGLSSSRSRKTSCRVDLRSCRSRKCAFYPAWSGFIGELMWSGRSSWPDRRWEHSISKKTNIFSNNGVQIYNVKLNAN